MDRVDYRQEKKRSIFLAEWKYWFGKATKTTQACGWLLGAFVTVCLIITSINLQVRKLRVT